MDESTARSSLRALPWPATTRRVVRRVRALRNEREQRRLNSRLAGPKILRAFADAYPTAFFVEIGANDGEQHDHLRPILTTHPWRGIMVEPVPYVFERLRTNYQGLPGVALENAAIAHEDGHLPFYYLRQADDRNAAELPQWYDGIGSFSREAVLNHSRLVPGLEDRLASLEVQCLTFDSLCRKHGVDRVDLLLVDTEGYDREILGSIDWNVHRPRLLVYEHYHLSSPEQAQLSAELIDLGYELKQEGFDTWCLQVADDDHLTARFHELSPALPPASVERDR